MFQKWFLSAVLFTLPPVYLLTSKVPDHKRTDNYIPCNKGWFYFGERCYKMFGAGDTRLNWHDASKRCNSFGGHLATIQSEEVQEFLFTFLLLKADKGAWIGLNDIQKESSYIWDDGTKYNYSNWGQLKPMQWKDKMQEDCVEMLLRVYQGEPGKWNDRLCTEESPYICQVDVGQITKRSLDPTLCSSAKGGGWKFDDSCYNTVNESMTWEQAEKYCQDQYKGHLVKVLKFHVEYFLKYIMSNFNTDIWIGIKIKEQFQQQFSSGWNVVYTNWNLNPQSFVDGSCIIRTKETIWKTVSCTKSYPFICETSTVSPPVLKKPPEDTKCPDEPKDWRDLGGEFCYFIDTNNSFNWYRAYFECIRRGGSLASIHSKEEIDVLAPFVKGDYSPLQYTAQNVFIGLHRTLTHGEAYVWADGSPMDYTYWSGALPSVAEEKCIGMLSINMKWHDIRCEITTGYICSVRKLSPNVTDTQVHRDCISSRTFITSIGVTVSIILVMILLPVVIYYFRTWKEKKRRITSVNTISLPPSVPRILQQMSMSDEYTEQDIVNDSDDGYEVMD